MTEFAHIVNPVAVDPTSDLFVAQPITFETMRRARRAAAHTVEVSFFSAQYAEDRAVVPDDFHPTKDLDRSVLDVAPQVTKRKLPFVKDILDRLSGASGADYFIFTNVDIAVKPEFYTGVARLIQGGYDAFALTRRNIPGHFRTIEEIPQMYVEQGTPQRGPDCFVFRRALYPDFRLENIFVGEPGIGRVLVCNLIRYGRHPVGSISDAQLTFHIGNDGLWKSRPDKAGGLNLESSLKIVRALYEETNDGERRALLQPHVEAVERMLRRFASGDAPVVGPAR